MVDLFIGTTNKVKSDPIIKAFCEHTQIIGSNNPVKSDPRIKNWLAECAVGQPFGIKQTAFGAISRTKHLIENNIASNNSHIISSENGLVTGKEIGLTFLEDTYAYDMAYVSYHHPLIPWIIIARSSQHALTECRASKNHTREEFNKYVKEYEKIIMPKIKQNIDLYIEWTNNSFTRSNMTYNCTIKALKEAEKILENQNVIRKCVNNGMCASIGHRYKYMLWVRDLSYMCDQYCKNGYIDQVIAALKTIASKQIISHNLIDTLYKKSYNMYGSLPIVTFISHENEIQFVKERFSEWINRIDETNIVYSDKIANIKSHDDAKILYELILKTTKIKPSFSLKKYIEGTLEYLTPGTRDSEIHFLKTLFHVMKYTQTNILDDFLEVIERSLKYITTNLINKDIGLPTGGDQRDVFSDIFYDAICLTNCMFFLEIMNEIKNIISSDNHHEFNKIIIKVFNISNDPRKYMNDYYDNLKNNIIKTFVHEDYIQDFVCGDRAKYENFMNPLQPMPENVKNLIIDNLDFLQGKQPDPQSIALAILNDVISPTEYNKIIKILRSLDSLIGITTFIPMAGNNEKERELINKNNGRVVWPNVAWLVVEALIKMNTPNSLCFAEEQREKLLKYCSKDCREWYAVDGDESFGGGEIFQGWSASSFLTTSEKFYDVYSNTSNS